MSIISTYFSLTGLFLLLLNVNSFESTNEFEISIPESRLSGYAQDANEPPVITITHPSDGFEENFATGLSIHVDASDPDGTISKVEFYVNGDRLGKDLAPPYLATWSHHPEGTHSIVAIAYDNDGATNSDTSIYIYERPKCDGAGLLTWEVWPGIPGYDLSSVPFHTEAEYINSETILDFETGQYHGNSYGSRIRGYLCLPMSGYYTFWIASDDDGQLWLSEDENPKNKNLIAYVDGHTAYRDYNKYPTQQSDSIYLEQGVNYYIEAIHKEAGGNDHLSVRWKLPDGTIEAPIPGKRVIHFDEGPTSPATNEPPVITITHPADGFEENFANGLNIYVETSDPDGTIAKVEYFVNGDKLGEDLAAPYEMSWSHHPEGTHSIVAIAYDNDGATASDTSAYIYERPKCDGAGLLTWEVWPGIPGYDLSSVPFHTEAEYGNSQTILDFETGQYHGNGYGSRIRGYLCLPMSGYYTFWIASDDDGQLWLSEDENPKNKHLIAYVDGHTAYRDYNKYPTQQSDSIYLEQGVNYYIEAIHKEAGGNDHLSVRWKLPDGTIEAPIPGKRIIHFDYGPMAEAVTDNAIVLYPNPTTSGEVTLSIIGQNTSEGSEAEVHVISFTGEVVFSEKVSCKPLSRADILLNLKQEVPPGIYLVKVLQQNKQFSTKLVIK